jgi:hypothetical protein
MFRIANSVGKFNDFQLIKISYFCRNPTCIVEMNSVFSEPISVRIICCVDYKQHNSIVIVLAE